jgi:hypothetical protein
MGKLIAALVGAAFIGLLVVAIGALFALPVMWLWNEVVVNHLGLTKALDFWHAWGLLVLCGLLFRSSSD